MFRQARGAAVGLVLLAAMAAVGCQTQLMPTPNLYVYSDDDPWSELPPALQGTTVDLLYVTDRSPLERADGSIRYGYGRSLSTAFGTVKVEIGSHATWEELVAASRARKRKGSWPLKVTSITELGRFPKTPLPLVERDGEIVEDPDVEAKELETAADLRAELLRRLALTPLKDVFVYVHGFNNTFEYASYIGAEFWHFGGRQGVPVVYSWPAGSPGLLHGYARDRESGEFTIFHLKQLLRYLASIPEIRKINVVAHSRGTDVAASALRELLIEARAAGLDPRQRYRIGQVVLAAPDLDFDILSQRFAAERFFEIMERLTIYVSKRDQAIGLAEWLFASRGRLGKLEPDDLDAYTRALLDRSERIEIVEARVKTGSLGHAYFHSSPAVSSDMILDLRDNVAPGSPGRPLREVIPSWWVIDDEKYPFLETPK